MAIYYLPDAPVFPPVEHAEPDGLLAVGGDLTSDRLLAAYEQGIFPWFSEGDPIMWWSPDPRFVLFPKNLHISKSTKQLLRKNPFSYSFDTEFDQVISSCKHVPRKGQSGTWITPSMREAYLHLHRLGYAHSLEVWQGHNLVGGLYGISLGTCFFGESMFSLVNNASKLGFIKLVHFLEGKGFSLIDCQVYTEHLERQGARLITRVRFLELLKEGLQTPTRRGSWKAWFDGDSPQYDN